MTNVDRSKHIKGIATHWTYFYYWKQRICITYTSSNDCFICNLWYNETCDAPQHLAFTPCFLQCSSSMGGILRWFCRFSPSSITTAGIQRHLRTSDRCPEKRGLLQRRTQEDVHGYDGHQKHSHADTFRAEPHGGLVFCRRRVGHTSTNLFVSGRRKTAI